MQRRSSRAGFTLIELLVVIAILGLLAALVAPKFVGVLTGGKRTQAAVQIRNLENALEMYYVDNGRYPTTEQGLQALVEKPTIAPLPKKWREGGYLEKGRVPADPWGNAYVYLSPGIHNRDFDIISYGRDGQEGGDGEDADINSWELEKETQG